MPREHVQLQSTALRSASYDDDLSQMEITFASGETYGFDNVPRNVFEELRDAASPGSFYHANIRGRY